MNDAKFKSEYKKAVDSISLPENYKNMIISELSQEKNSHNRRYFYIKVLASVAAVLVIAFCVGVFAKNFAFPINNPEEVSFKIMSATNLGAVKGARVAFVNTSKKGKEIVSVADEKGVVTATLSKDDEYKAYVTAEGYIDYELADFQSGNVYISPEMDEDTYRAVLMWQGDCDLDAFLTVSRGDEKEQLHYFKSDIKDENGDVIAALDTDSASGSAPETVTFNAQNDEVFTFSVGSYSALKDKSANISDSEPRVLLYKGKELLKEFSISSEAKGNVWTVFEIEEKVLSELCDVYSVESFEDVK